MKKIVIRESDLILIIEAVANEAGDLYKKHNFGSENKFYIILVKKEELEEYKKSFKSYMNSFEVNDDLKPKKYFLSQYYDGSCCFISKHKKDDKVKPVTFSSDVEAQKELDFMVKHSPKIMNNFIARIVKYNSKEWK